MGCLILPVIPVSAQDLSSNAVLSEQTIILDNPVNKTLIELNLPAKLYPGKNTLIVFYALPNGNSIEWTKGRSIRPGDDWHFDIQHIAAQTRWLRAVMTDQNLIVAYMANQLKSWPAWKRQQAEGPKEIKRMVDSVATMFSAYHPQVMLNSHSGGGSFIFGYLDAVETIPAEIRRIAFIDSDYGYEDSLHTYKLALWLQSSKDNHLTVLAYNDSVVIYNGKPLVSPTGGTWYRSQLMQRKLAGTFHFKSKIDTGFMCYSALSNRIDIRLKTNLQGKIYHTEQVARNGFIHTVINGTKYQRKARSIYWGERVYGDFMSQ